MLGLKCWVSCTHFELNQWLYLLKFSRFAVVCSCLISFILEYFSNLKDNSLGTITANIFGGTSSISQYLYLTNNGLTGISSNAFDNVAINYIYLADNLLEDVPLALQSQNPLRL